MSILLFFNFIVTSEDSYEHFNNIETNHSTINIILKNYNMT